MNTFQGSSLVCVQNSCHTYGTSGFLIGFYFTVQHQEVYVRYMYNVTWTQMFIHLSPTWPDPTQFWTLRTQLNIGYDTFGPKRIWSPTMGPQLIGPSGQTVPNQFGPHGQMVPQNLVPMDKWSLEYSVCPGGHAVWIRK